MRNREEILKDARLCAKGTEENCKSCSKYGSDDCRTNLMRETFEAVQDEDDIFKALGIPEDPSEPIVRSKNPVSLEEAIAEAFKERGQQS